MKKLFLFTLSIFIFTNLVAQTDSLKTLLKQTIPDTTRVSVLFELSQAYRDSGELGMQYIHQALDLASDMDDPVLMGLAYHKIGYFHFLKGNFQKAIESYQKALAILNPSSGTNLVADVNNDLDWFINRWVTMMLLSNTLL